MWGFTTRQVHAAQEPDPVTGSRALPIYQTTAYAFEDAEQAHQVFSGRKDGFTYSRTNNPTQAVVEQRISNLEGGIGGLLVASGQAAILYTVFTLTHTGGHIVASPSLYGGTRSLLENNLAKRGITTTFVEDPSDPESWRAASRPETTMFFGESIPNPRGDILDVEAVAAVAHECGVPLVVDNTVATPYVLRPLEWGADIVVHSVSKYLSGHGNVLAGCIVDGGTFNYASHPNKYPDFLVPVPGFAGLVVARDYGPEGSKGVAGVNESFIVKARLEQAHDVGAAIAPISAFLVAQGLETLSLRMDRHLENAGVVARWLAQHPRVKSVNYSSLEESPWRDLSQKYTPKGPGAVLSFEVDGGLAAGKAFVSALQLHSIAANIGDVRSLAVHPATTTHARISPQAQAASGVFPGSVRLSVGIEDIEDILADLKLGFAAAEVARTHK